LVNTGLEDIGVPGKELIRVGDRERIGKGMLDAWKAGSDRRRVRDGILLQLCPRTAACLRIKNAIGAGPSKLLFAREAAAVEKRHIHMLAGTGDCHGKGL
jgi:hypothetical protein